METYTYNKLYDTIKNQYPEKKNESKIGQQEINLKETYNKLYNIYNNPTFDNILNKIKISVSSLNEEKKEQKDNINDYIYLSKNYT